MRCCIDLAPSRAWRNSARRFGGVILLLSLASGCGRPPPATLELPVYFTCDTHGRLEPCGCFVGQFGGLTRLKTVLDVEAPPEAVRVDVGDAAGGPEDYDFIGYRYMLRAFAALNYDAVNMGRREARFSAARLRELKQGMPVPILSANVLDRATRRPIFDSWRLVRRGGFQVGIIGVLDPRATDGLGDGVAVGDMESAIERSLTELRGRADLVLLLAFTDEATLSRLAREFYECQVILGGKVSQPAQELLKENRSFVYFVTNESRALGLLRLRLARGAPVEATGHEIRLLHDRIPQDASFRELMQRYRDEIRRTRLAVDDPAHTDADAVPGVRTAATFVGTAKCIECHKGAGSVWGASAHARAFGTLIERKADADPKCVGCHTIGFGAASGYRRAFGRNELVDVGCEACHGAGSLHVRQREGDRAVNFTFRPLDAGDCVKCHYGEFSRPFDWEQFWPAIRHGKENRTTASIDR